MSVFAGGAAVSSDETGGQEEGGASRAARRRHLCVKPGAATNKRSGVCRVPVSFCACARVASPGGPRGRAGRGCRARRGLGRFRREVAARCRALSAPLTGGGGFGAVVVGAWATPPLKRGGSSELCREWRCEIGASGGYSRSCCSWAARGPAWLWFIIIPNNLRETRELLFGVTVWKGEVQAP